MSVDAYSVLAYVHILLFVYWLGGDLGVFMTSRNVANPALSLDERLRFLKVLLAVDMAPRTALILFVPVGFQMAAMMGLSPITGPTLAAVWVFDLLWLGMNWWIYRNEHRPAAAKLRGVDMYVRYLVIAVMGTMGLVSLIRGQPLTAPWLGAKVFLFAVIMSLGVYLRVELRHWAAGFALIRQGGDAVAAGNAMIASSRKRTRIAALTLWFGVALVAFIGRVKPF